MALLLCQKSYVHIWVSHLCRDSITWVKGPGNVDYQYSVARRKRSQLITKCKMCAPLPNVVAYVVHCERRDGRVDDCGCLENSWVNSPGGSNPSPSVKRPVAFLVA